ncbi:MAG: site-specific DNA-methyltransferase [Armatimonadetes bacterium]|nr:site-specific DNA-methyltransferase [Anaerolineae bacterium]
MPVQLLTLPQLPAPNQQWQDTLIVGDSWEAVKHLPTNHVQCIVTSPPYFGHRKYAEAQPLQSLEFGRETELNVYIDKLVALFATLKGVLTEDGTLWLNLGDTYRDHQLLGIPWRVALALQDAGWILRSEVIWHKPNAMPSSVKNRPTVDHETLFLFAKTPHYYYNADAIREPHITFSDESKMRGGRKHLGKRDGTPEQGKNKGNNNLHDGRWDQAFHPLGRNKRTVWNIPLGKFRDAHFAVFPPKLVETCILASSAEGQIVLDPFMGSGTTAMVVKQLNRYFIGVELVPEYAEMTLNRLKPLEQQPLLI